MDEKRKSNRRRTLKDGKIIFADGMRMIDCTIRNMTDGGAQLVLSDTIGLPTEFYLFEKSAGLVHKASLKWRKASAIGVTLSDPINVNETTDRRFSRLKVL